MISIHQKSLAIVVDNADTTLEHGGFGESRKHETTEYFLAYGQPCGSNSLTGTMVLSRAVGLRSK